MGVLRLRRTLTVTALAGALAVLAVSLGELRGASSPHAYPGLSGAWTVIGRGARGGRTWLGAGAGAIAAIYLPRGASPARRLMAVYLELPRGAVRAVRGLRLADGADQLIWQGTTPAFAVVVVRGDTAASLMRAAGAARAHLPVQRGRGGSVVMRDAHDARALASLTAPRVARSFATAVALGVPPSGIRRARAQQIAARGRGQRLVLVPGHDGPGAPTRRALLSGLATALAPLGAVRASASARGMLPRSFSRIAVGPAGGTIWQGVIPGVHWASAPRASLIYLPPFVRRRRRYPVVYLLHGIRGAPYSFPGGLRLTAVADRLIASRRARPFIAVMPPAGQTPAYEGEWTGIWERYVMHSVVRYVDRVLPTIRRARARAIGGLSAGGYGAVDMALRHPGVFDRVESWSGYFRAPRDGSLAHASARERAAHDPSLLLRREAPALRAAGVRFYLSAGGRDREALAPTRRFARELTRLGLHPALVVTQGGHSTASWRAGLSRALRFAVGRP